MSCHEKKPRTASESSRKTAPLRSRPAQPPRHIPKSELEMYRVEGIGRRGTIRYVKVAGIPGQWRITGIDGLRIEVGGQTVQDALRMARRQIPFRPMVVKRVGPGGTDYQPEKPA
jgi:hypothetical protein